MVEELIRRARRRLLLNAALSECAFAAAVTAAGFALLLLLGTRFLEWWTVAVFAATGVALGAYRISRRVPGAYATAIRLDENAHLEDSLSTAVHFSKHTDATLARFRTAQREHAENLARGVTLESAFPFTFPRALYAMAALALLCSGLIAIRYRMGRGLDLRSPITEILFEDQALHEAKKKTPPGGSRDASWAQQAQEMMAKLGIKTNTDNTAPGDDGDLSQAIQQALQPSNKKDGSDAKDGKNGPSDQKAAQGKDGLTSGDQAGGDPIDGADKQSGDKDSDASASAKNNQSDKANSDSKKDGDSGAQESLLDKIKSAVSNLLSKTQPEQKNSQQQQNNPSQTARNEQQKAGKKGQNGQGTPEKGNGQSDSDSDPSGDALGGQQGQGNEKTASNQRQAQEGSGIGSQDGLKDLREAEQIKAMGKISEIIGRRSATISGDTSIEVQSGDQRLRTSYSNSIATHSETDGDVTRDEIPLALQPYVQQYFEEVHKTPPNGADKKANPKGGAQ